MLPCSGRRPMNSINTPYDDVFRTLLTDCRDLIIPIVNEVFQEDYTGREEIALRQNEIFLRQQNGKEEKQITDSSFAILNDKGWRNYHLECQSTPDGTMLIRMYEYDSQIALIEGTMENNVLNVNFPQSAVLYLRHTKKTPDNLMICINTPGGKVSYNVPVMKVQQYDIDTIFRKKLLFLIPFYIFTYENKLQHIAENEVSLRQLKRMFADIVKRLDELCIAGELTEYTKQTICEMSEKVIRHLAEKYEVIKKEVAKIMGGEVLEYPAKTILRQGIAQGIEQGMEQAARKMLQKGTPCEEVADILDMELAEVQRLVD